MLCVSHECVCLMNVRPQDLFLSHEPTLRFRLCLMNRTIFPDATKCHNYILIKWHHLSRHYKAPQILWKVPQLHLIKWHIFLDTAKCHKVFGRCHNYILIKSARKASWSKAGVEPVD